MQIHDPQKHTYPEKVSTKNPDDEWTVKRVILWLEANDFRPAVDFFKGNLFDKPNHSNNKNSLAFF